MGYIVDNAVILAAGLSSRFAPLSYEKPKALIEVKGEVLIERQIRQLLEKGIHDIILVVGYKKEQLYYLKKKFGIRIIENRDYMIRNNHSSIYAARRYLKNTYICSADNYFITNPFEKEVDESYYAALFASATTNEWCLRMDKDDYITEVEIGGKHEWYMMGQVFWSEVFSRKFMEILVRIYDEETTKNKLWEDIYREHIRELKMKIRRYCDEQIFEFDTLDELRIFDNSYFVCSGSLIMQKIANSLRCPEGHIMNLRPIKDTGGKVTGVAFEYIETQYRFLYADGRIVAIGKKNE